MNRNGKSHYTEIEAAQELGISLENLRTLVRCHVLPDSEEELSKLSMTSFQASDLLLLKLLSGDAVRTASAS
jgi:hypothetical protein